MDIVPDYPRSRAFARLERALAKLYPNSVEYRLQLSDHIAMFFALGRSPQGFAIANQTMSELADHYTDLCRRPRYWATLANAHARQTN
ncbi:hypothetical protein [Hyphomicrobium sp.]|uniref:hypothetical protein n=1 Tax=Hyphomicrobium sp. TaxID=82 RepID=UPI002E37B642|nr:hypothetical protein [Hyphomicrobium sp.]HEX2841386.1 hypothetical protein [Hyphomicrobium sp.]